MRHGVPGTVATAARGGIAAAPEGTEQADDVGMRRQPLVQLELVAHRIAALATELSARALLDHDLGPARLVLRPVDRAARGAVELLEQHKVAIAAVGAKLLHGAQRRLANTARLPRRSIGTPGYSSPTVITDPNSNPNPLHTRTSLNFLKLQFLYKPQP